MINGRDVAGKGRGRVVPVLLVLVFGLGGCEELPKAPLPDEQQVGPPLA